MLPEQIFSRQIWLFQSQIAEKTGVRCFFKACFLFSDLVSTKNSFFCFWKVYNAVSIAVAVDDVYERWFMFNFIANATQKQQQQQELRKATIYLHTLISNR